MFLTYHQSDLAKVPSEDEVSEALRKYNIPPGDYFLPYGGSAQAMKNPEFIEKMTKGPVIIMTVMKSGPPSMTGSLAQWFIYCILVGIVAAYIAGRALSPDVHYLSVFRFVGCTAFVGYSMALIQNSIWYQRKWSSTLKSMFDGFIYALVTAGVFGWLWPRP
jgi:hypothetical protein